MIRRITDYLEKNHSKLSDKTAYTDKNSSVTFEGFRSGAMHIAQALIDEGLFKRPVVVYMEKNVQSLISFIGSAYSGNFYTPIDISMPDERIKKIVATLEPAAVITLSESSEKASELFPSAKVIIFENEQKKTINEEKIIETQAKIIDSDILYIIFTSGSTGVPKGVCVSHRAVIDYIEWITEKFGFDETTVIGNQVPLYFDLSIQDVFSPLKTGCTTHILPPEFFGFPKKLMDYMCERKINTIVWVPTALCIMAAMKALKLENIPPLTKVFFAGEVMPNKQLNKWRKAYPDAMFINMYGPTEVANIATWYIIDREFADDEPVPMGWPCENIDVLVLNEDNKPIEKDEIGELCVRGTCLSHGYYNNPEKTKEVFVQNPLNDKYPELIYHTGDLVRFNEYGELVYVSRKDFQVKHNGYRIELGEIDNVVSSVHGVELSCTLYDHKRSCIVLFYTGNVGDEDVSLGASGGLPDYMLPGRIEHLDQMPLNPNGKIDRTKLQTMI